MESYGEHTQTRTFENHANLLAYLANHRCTLRRMAFNALLNAKAALSYIGFSLRLLFEKVVRTGSYLRTQLRVLSIVGTSTICLRIIKSSTLLSTST